MLAVLLLSTFLAAHPAPGPDPLRDAEAALVEGRWDQVRASAQAALDGELTLAEQRRALELLATAEAAFGRDAEAVHAFRKLISIDSSYLPPPETSPKLLVLFARAREAGPAPGVSPPAPAEATRVVVAEPSAPGPERPGLLSRWWFWTAVGVVAVGSGVAAWELSRSEVPTGTLGTGALR